MTDYYKVFREKYEKDPKLSVGEMGFEENIADDLAVFISSTPSIWGHYSRDLPLTEEAWAEIERECRIWNSPLMKALS